MELWHSKEYLNNSKKIKKVAKFLTKADVVCLQESVPGEEWNKALDDFGMVTRQGSTSMILYRKSMFPEPEDVEFKKKYLDIIYWNNDTVFIKKGNHLIISGHLTSKDHNKTQAAKMF